MDPTPTPTDLHPRYWLARCMAWLWLDHPGDPDRGEWAQHYDTTRTQVRSWIGLLRQAHERLCVAQIHQQRYQQVLEAGQSRGQLAQACLEEAMATAAPRFDAQDPDALAWTRARAALDEALAQERAAAEDGQALEQGAHAEVVGLVSRGYGTPDYAGNAMARWRDERAAQKHGFGQFQQQRQALLGALAAARQAREHAEREEASAAQARQRAWEASGPQYVDPVMLEHAQAIHALAGLDEAELAARKQEADRECVQARQGLTQSLHEFHLHGGVAVAELARRVGQALGEDATEDQHWPDIDRCAFVLAGRCREMDSRRRDSLTRANRVFLGQHGPEEGAVPAWLVLAYGNADGLPGTSMAQAAMGAQCLE